jgi:hypothetical protein
MTPTEVKYNRRYKTGDYEHEDFTVTAVLDKGDDVVATFGELRADIAKAFAAEVGEPEAEEVPAATAPGKKNKKAKEEEPEEVEEEDPEETPEDPEEEESEEEETEEEEEETEEEEAPPAKTGKKFKKKPQVYNRASEAHKEIFSKMLAGISPGWNKKEDVKARAGKASKDMEGQEFLDEEGNVLDSFSNSVKKLMKKK